jgi:hypothetical protein
MRSLFTVVTIAACAVSCVFSKAQESPSQPQERTSLSPDKKWEYQSDESAPKIVKAGTNEMALDLSDQPAGNGFSFATVIWAPDSKRVAFNYGQGRTHATSLYQLSGDKWKALKSPEDDAYQRETAIVAAQLRRKGLSEKKLSKQNMWLRLISWTVEVRQWIDPNTAIVYASLGQVAARRDAPGEMSDSFGTDLLLTLKFDDAGTWKVVKAHEMTGKAVESPSLSTPLADEIVYRSPHGSYRIQASADGTALWIVPTNDPSRRKPLLGANPDNRLPEEFSASPNDTWLFDNRQHELYRNTDDFAFSVFNRKQWFWKNALDYASKEFHLSRGDVDCDSGGWSFDSARLLINFKIMPENRFVYFNTRTKAFEQTPYLRMVNTRLHAEKPWEAFPNVTFAGENLARYMVFAEPIDLPPSEAILKPHFTALDREMNTLREKGLADLATRRDKSIVEFRRWSNDKWNKAREEAVQLYVPFASKAEQETRKLQFLCDLTQKEVNGLKKLAPADTSDKSTTHLPSPAASPP